VGTARPNKVVKGALRRPNIVFFFWYNRSLTLPLPKAVWMIVSQIALSPTEALTPIARPTSSKSTARLGEERKAPDVVPESTAVGAMAMPVQAAL